MDCPSCSLHLIEERLPLWKQRSFHIIAVSTLLLITGLYLNYFNGYSLQAHILLLLAASISGYSIVKKGLLSLLDKQPDMNFLMTMAAIGAFSIGYGEEGASILYLFFIAEFLEDYAGERARRSIGELMSLVPETAVVRRNGIEVTVHVHEIDIDEIAIVRPGDKIPLDGVVLSGESSVNQAAITGESMPVYKKAGDTVFAASLNEQGFLEIKVLKRQEDTLISKIAELVEEAEHQKSPTEKFVDKFAGYYTPAVISLAAGVAIIPPLLFNQPFEVWLYKALVLLVISCPCALAISTPVSMVSGITGAAKNGVLIKGGNYLEELAKSKVFVFDKTGTLTKGMPVVTDVIEVNDCKSREILSAGASIESLSEHPIAKAIVEKARLEKCSMSRVEGFIAIPGKGVRGNINGKTFYVGSPAMFQELSIPFPEEKVTALEYEGKTAILVGHTECVGIIAVMDMVRESAHAAIDALRKKGIRIVMLTGDNERIAKATARNLVMDEYHSGLLPEDKVRMINELNQKYGRVVMIGDGVNDAPAIAKAAVGIAMGSIGSDAALETADIALMHDDISKLPYLFELSEKTLDIVKQNIFVSLAVKGSFAVLVFPGIVTLWMAVGFGDMGLSLLVIINAMRLSVNRNI